MYDVPDDIPVALADAPAPQLLTQEQIAARNRAPLSDGDVANEQDAATALRARADAITQEQAALLEVRAGNLRNAAGALAANEPGLSANARALLARAARLRARAS
ncbi:hypothetical protein SAMN06273572_101401 [Monaibacterium marinum]|uniref:Uncharacterized protein n=1 Tax=Pontivivens marinum TaxID=1690039 RepID=A0A2C9CMM6_9RHOB|nr:hypothetical protein [Monaibacterium marinum]SOH92554.1 hypothetical protein SAMN06273572_101401 [Monaibacterium marinum]